jgi:hypothetical protein
MRFERLAVDHGNLLFAQASARRRVQKKSPLKSFSGDF